MKQAILIVLASAALTAGVIKASPAAAQDLAGQEVRSAVVSTAGLDLQTAAGRRALDVRLARAAREVCGSTSSIDLPGLNDLRGCRRAAFSSGKKRSAALARAPDVVVAEAR